MDFGSPVKFTADNLPYKERRNDRYIWEATEGTGLKVSGFECMQDDGKGIRHCYSSGSSNKVTVSLMVSKTTKK